MSWLTDQSWPSIVLALALGLLLGFLIWSRRWERVRTTRRDLLGHLTLTHARELADRDGQIQVLRDELDDERDEHARAIEELSRDLADCRAGRVDRSVTGTSGARVRTPGGTRD